MRGKCEASQVVDNDKIKTGKPQDEGRSCSEVGPGGAACAVHIHSCMAWPMHE